MGLYDTVWVNCQKCGEELGFQTKSGDCVLANYGLNDAPEDVMADVNRHSPIRCECGVLYIVDVPSRKLIDVTPDKV